jgi:hypothetical protein
VLGGVIAALLSELAVRDWADRSAAIAVRALSDEYALSERKPGGM